MTANMATCGTFEMAKALAPHRIITTFHKYYSIEDYTKFFKEFNNPDYVSYTLGIRDRDIKIVYMAYMNRIKSSYLLYRFDSLTAEENKGS